MNFFKIFYIFIFFLGCTCAKTQSLLNQLISSKKNVIFEKTVYFPDLITFKPVESTIFAIDSITINGLEDDGIKMYFQLDSTNTRHGWCLVYKEGKFCIIGKYFRGKQHETWYYYSYKNKNVIYKSSTNFENGKKVSVGYNRKKIRRKKTKGNGSQMPSIVDMF
ncbi:MAG TPA: hypothetical protein VK177_16460 [Flavobacteriales bacterium]|nr:hypothetical protein [Flavobacteriales bacterium]